jgi:hypothetical protein
VTRRDGGGIRARLWRVLAGAGALATAALPSGCSSDPHEGYAHLSTFDEDYRTIAIPILENETYVRGVEFELTDALIKEVEARTGWKVTASGSADTILLGRIRAVDKQQLSRSRLTGLGQEAIVGVTIDFEWRDLRTDRAIVARQGFAGHGLYEPSNPSAEREELGRVAAVQKLARDIVSELRASW